MLFHSQRAYAVAWWRSPQSAKRRRILEPPVRSGRGLLRSGLFSVKECAARLECKVQPAIRGHYADGGQHQIYDASPGQFVPVIVHDSPLFPVLTFEGLCGGIRAARLISGRYTGRAANLAAVW